VVLVGLGGAIGSVLRYLTSVLAAHWLGEQFPYGTLIVNLGGSFAIGLVHQVGSDSLLIPDNLRLFLTTGIMGGLSTFSSFVWGTHQMLANVAEQASAIVYLVLSMVAGFLLVELGLWLGGRLMRSHMEAAGARAEL